MNLLAFPAAALSLALLGCGAAAGAESADSISVTPGAVAFSFQAGGALPAEQKVQVKRGGSGPALDFAVTVPASAPWLIVTPAAGKTGTAVGVRVNPTSLLAGSYAVAVQISAAGVSNPAIINVSLTVRNPPPAPSALPASIAFTFQTDQSAPAAQSIIVSSSGEPVSFTAAASGGTWLSVDPPLGIAVTGSPVTIQAAVDVTGLVPGSYTGKITLSFPAAAVKTIVVPVTLTVTAGAPVIDSIWPSSAPVGSADAVVTIRGRHFFQTSVVQAGTTTLTPTWISTNVLLAVIPKALMSSPGTLDVTVANNPQPASAPATFTVTPPGPLIQTVVNAATFSAASPAVIAPGEIISIFGSGMGPGTLVQAAPSGGVFPTTLGTPATVVEFELSTDTWTAAPIIFAQANQVNAVAPFAMTAATGRRLRVTYNGITSAPFVFDAVDANPGIFTIDSSGRGQAAALNYNETTKVYSLNSTSNAAPKGSIVILYCTGGGVTTPAPSSEGQVIPLTAPVPQLDAPVSVTIAGDGATVQSATAVPGAIAGLVQINVAVPASVKAGKDLPVVVIIAGRASPAVATIAVK